MTKKNLLVRTLVMLVAISLTLPSFVQRIKNESDNNDVIIALNYNNTSMVLSNEEFDESLEENKKNGVKTLMIGEESINSLISAGAVTGIRYNVLCHKYDDESEEIIKLLKYDKRIHNDSYLLITKRSDCKEYLDKWIGAKFSEDEYVKITTDLGADVYLIYEAFGGAWQVGIGFDQHKLEYAKNKGFDIVLSMMLGAYSETEYIDHIADIVDRYDVKFINLKEAYKDQNGDKTAKKNIEAFCKLIKEKGLYLVLTENTTQLSNQKPIGYEKLIESAQGRVLRSYETVDFDSTNTGPTAIDKRYHQVLNSVVDRNIRFVVVNQLTNGTDNFGEKSKKTNASTKEIIEKLNKVGYNTKSYDTCYDYNVNRRLTSAAAMVLMIIMCLTVLEWLCKKRLRAMEIMASLGAVLSVGFTYVAPMAIVHLYPTLFALVMPVFSVTALMIYVKEKASKLSTARLIISSLILSGVLLVLGGIVQSSLLGGLDYYINSIIFRGIKLSLLVPIAYGAVAYVIIFMDKSLFSAKSIIKILNSTIKVYWVIIGVAVAVAGAVYIIRSGNVSSISPIEAFMRNTITELMTARPRTKEFLVGWPCLVMFLYCMKNVDAKILQWCLAVGSAILFASVTNSFCHVFTGAAIIFMRVVNGFVIGALISLALLVAIAIIKKIAKKYFLTGKE